MREEQELANIFGHFVSASEANSVRTIQLFILNVSMGNVNLN